MAVITKVPVVPVTAAPIAHHRELPEGHYKVELDGFGSQKYLLWEMNTGNRYLIFWGGQAPIFREFRITSEGGVINEETGLPDNPGC